MIPDITQVRVKPNALAIYGYTNDSGEFWTNWGEALLIISGADEVVSTEEMTWLMDYLGGTIGVGGDVLKRFLTFDFRTAQLDQRLHKITADTSIHCGRALLYDAIRMSRADHDYAIEERQAVHGAAVVLGVAPGIAAAIEHIVEKEEAMGVTRLSCIDFDDTYDPSGTDENPIIQTNPMFKSIYGVDKVLYQTMESYGNALLWVAGADGVISDDERSWLIDSYAPSMDVPSEISQRWDDIIHSEQFRCIKIDDQLARIIGPNDGRKQLLYDAIRMAWVDGYDQREQDAVIKTAGGLGVTTSLVKVLENLVASEYLLNEMRRALFRA